MPDLQQIGMILQLVVSGVTTLYGYKALSKEFRHELHDAMRGKVDLAVYSSKVKDLHDEINTLKTRVAVLEAEASRAR